MISVDHNPPHIFELKLSANRTIEDDALDPEVQKKKSTNFRVAYIRKVKLLFKTFFVVSDQI